jgi:hypothetical protein
MFIAGTVRLANRAVDGATYRAWFGTLEQSADISA